jgi:hypothetical protein
VIPEHYNSPQQLFSDLLCSVCEHRRHGCRNIENESERVGDTMKCTRSGRSHVEWRGQWRCKGKDALDRVLRCGSDRDDVHPVEGREYESLRAARSARPMRRNERPGGLVVTPRGGWTPLEGRVVVRARLDRARAQVRWWMMLRSRCGLHSERGGARSLWAPPEGWYAPLESCIVIRTGLDRTRAWMRQWITLDGELDFIVVMEGPGQCPGIPQDGCRV